MIYTKALMVPSFINTLRPRQNGCHFADGIFKSIFFKENVRISIDISLKFVPKGHINDIPALAQIIVWRQSWCLVYWRQCPIMGYEALLTFPFQWRFVADKMAYFIPYGLFLLQQYQLHWFCTAAIFFKFPWIISPHRNMDSYLWGRPLVAGRKSIILSGPVEAGRIVPWFY